MDLFFLYSHFSLTIVYIIYLRHVHLLNDHIGLCFILHVLTTCLDVAFIKTCVNTCTTSEPKIDYYMFVLNCSFVAIRCTIIA